MATGRPLTNPGSDRIGSDWTDKTWIGSGRTHKTRIWSNSIKKTKPKKKHIYTYLASVNSLHFDQTIKSAISTRQDQNIKEITSLQKKLRRNPLGN